MLLVFASIAVVGITVFIIQRLAQTEVKIDHLKSIYVAQAGINESVYKYQERALQTPFNIGYISSGNYNIDDDHFFEIKKTDDLSSFLVVGLSEVLPLGIITLVFSSVHSVIEPDPITIDKLKISWNSKALINRLYINGVQLWLGVSRSPLEVDINDFTLSNPSDVPADVLLMTFLGNMGKLKKLKINVDFIMTDATSKSVSIYPIDTNYINIFSFESKGELASDVNRTIRATYRINDSKIIDYSEK